MNRRNFLKNTATAFIGAVSLSLPSLVFASAKSKSEEVTAYGYAIKVVDESDGFANGWFVSNDEGAIRVRSINDKYYQPWIFPTKEKAEHAIRKTMELRHYVTYKFVTVKLESSQWQHISRLV